MQGTEWIEETFIADKKFFTLPSSDSYGIQANYSIVETRDGYFEVVF